MPSVYPGAIDNLNNPTAGDNLDTAAVIHNAQHTNVNDAVEAIEGELGINPSGASPNVADRLTAIDNAIVGKALAADEGVANGIATLDAGTMLVQNVHADKVNTGTLNVARIPNISGAKVLGTGSGGAAIPVDALPNHDAAKVTSGTFHVDRIPAHDASKVTSGVFNAARIPTTVTSNANAKEVADLAARDAIPVPDRVAGMLVFVRTLRRLYAWRSDNSTWVGVGLGKVPMVKMAGPAKSYSHGVAADVDLSVTRYDTDAMADLVNNQVLCNTAGCYDYSGHVDWTSNTTVGYRALLILKNGVIERRVTMDPATGFGVATEMEISGDMDLAVGDIVKLQALQTNSTGGNPPISTQAPRNDSNGLSLHFFGTVD